MLKTMSRDFTPAKYAELLDALAGYGEITLRHDVDLRPRRSLEIAKLEATKGWKAVYYFRAVPESFDEAVIREIASLGHEIGYHYENLAACGGDFEAAWEDFKKNLKRLRAIAPVSKICMHGSPLSKFDSRELWRCYDYRSEGCNFEPYLDTDWSSCFYLTDTGRRWDGFRVSLRDRIPQWQDRWIADGLVYHSTDDIIAAASKGLLPRRIMITTHPQRWVGALLPWLSELMMQNAKNAVKRLINR